MTQVTPLINQIPPPPPPNKRRLSDDLPPFLGGYIPTFSAQEQRRATAQTGGDFDWYIAYAKSRWHATEHMLRHQLQQRQLKDFLDIRILLILLWSLVLWQGERRTFDNSVRRCDWRYWEQWPPDAVPEHVILVADPQLVDPHTYPGRPWPLSTLTVWYTDAYLRKGFSRLGSWLDPDATFFLGDLFDGGREWSVDGEGDKEDSMSPHKQWRKFKNRFWFKEYRRFGRIFLDDWLNDKRRRRSSRRLTVGLPGNHDLGLGSGIRLPVRDRFNAYFGGSNRVDIVGNHTFVSVDSVSLSAKGQPNPDSSSPDQDMSKAIWEPTDTFLHEVQAIKGRAMHRNLRLQRGEAENEKMDYEVIDLSDSKAHTIFPEAHECEIPSILLTHVPLFRPEGTPCGPLREHLPPSNPPPADGKDPQNAIKMQYGEQYQNVLTSQISTELVDLIGGVTHVFSGDDHDYCDIVHREFTGTGPPIREITVKSLSWAMGIRKPGFVMLSLWNPINDSGRPLGTKGRATVQTHLCLMPDQLSIFIRYAWMLILTLTVIIISAARRVYSSKAIGQDSSGLLDSSVLPISRISRPKPEAPAHSATSSTSDAVSSNGLSARAKARGASPSNGYGYAPPQATLMSEDIGQGKSWQDIDLNAGPGKPRGKLSSLLLETRRGMVFVGLPVLVWYLWLLKHS